jgi:hypothetical protein
VLSPLGAQPEDRARADAVEHHPGEPRVGEGPVPGAGGEVGGEEGDVAAGEGGPQEVFRKGASAGGDGVRSEREGEARS